MRLKYAIVFVACLGAAQHLRATAQAADILHIDGQTYSIHTNPLEPWLEAHPKAMPKPEVTSSGNWRGYVATWAIRDGKLLLEDVMVEKRDGKRASVLNRLFPDEGAPQATWYTGRLIAPTGEMVQYVHMGYGSTYASYLVATVVDGSVKQTRNLSLAEFEAFRRSQFEKFKKTAEYAKSFADAKSGEGTMSNDEIENFLFLYESSVFVPRIFPGDE